MTEEEMKVRISELETDREELVRRVDTISETLRKVSKLLTEAQQGMMFIDLPPQFYEAYKVLSLHMMSSARIIEIW